MAVEIQLRVNGTPRQGQVEPRLLLVHYLRDVLGLTGTHIGCETTLCGACTVLLDGKAVKSCTVLAVQADGTEVTTIEGLAAQPEAGGQAPSGQGRILGDARTAVRLLHAGNDHDLGRAAA